MDSTNDKSQTNLIDSFLKSYDKTFEFSCMVDDEKVKLFSAVSNILDSTDDATDAVCKTLGCIRILSRDKSLTPKWMTERIFDHLMRLSGLLDYCLKGDSVTLVENMNVTAITEATRCLCNLVFNSGTVQQMCFKSRCVLALIQRAKTYCDVGFPHQIKYLDMRLLFITTALIRECRKQACLEWNAISVLAGVTKDILKQMTLSDEDCDLLAEILKALYNLLLVVSPWTQEFAHIEADLLALSTVLYNTTCHECVTKEKHIEIVRHCVNLYTVLPKETATCLVPSDSESERSFEGHDITCLNEMLKYAEETLEGSTLSTQKDQILPILAALTALSKANRIIRKYLRLKILPHLRDEVKRLPEEGDSLRNRLCKLLTSPITEVKQMVAEFLFVLCKESVSRLIKYSGFGNAAGLLAQYGLLRSQTSVPTNYSSDSDSETEEYKELEPNVNPVTGRFEESRNNPMENMTDEQKEFEADQLLNAMDKLQRLGVIQPSRVGADGRPEPVQHVLQLAENIQMTDPHSSDED